MQWLASDYRRLQRRLRRLFWRSGRTREEAEDLIQDALLRLQEYCRKMPLDTEPLRDREAFLIRTVRNLNIDRHRRAHLHLYASETVEELDRVAPLIDPGPSSDVIFEAQQRLHRIGAILDAVGGRTRDIYFAHRAGYSYAEIEAHFGVSRSTVEKHIARAVLALLKVRKGE